MNPNLQFFSKLLVSAEGLISIMAFIRQSLRVDGMVLILS